MKYIHVEDNIASKNMHKPPAQVEQIATDLGPITRKTDEFVTPQAIVRSDNDEWIIVGMSSKGNAQKQWTRTTKKDQHCNALPVQTAPVAPGSGGQVNAKTSSINARENAKTRYWQRKKGCTRSKKTVRTTKTDLPFLRRKFEQRYTRRRNLGSRRSSDHQLSE